VIEQIASHLFITSIFKDSSYDRKGRLEQGRDADALVSRRNTLEIGGGKDTSLLSLHAVRSISSWKRRLLNLIEG
jgi:hypothetical protein